MVQRIQMEQFTFAEDAIVAEAKGRAGAEYAAWLREEQQLDGWVLALADMKREIEMQLVQRAADLAATKADSFRKGEAGKQEYFDAEAQLGRWRAGTLHLKSKLESRLQEAKTLRHAREQKRNAERPMNETGLYESQRLFAQVARLSQICVDLESRLAAVEAWLREAESDPPAG